MIIRDSCCLSIGDLANLQDTRQYENYVARCNADKDVDSSSQKIEMKQHFRHYYARNISLQLIV